MTTPPTDPMVNQTQELAAAVAALAASNDELTRRANALNTKIGEKAEQSEFKRTKSEARWSLVLNVAHIAAFVIAFLFGLGFVHAQDETKALAACVARADEAQQDNTNQLRDAATKERVALRTLVDAMVNPALSQDERRDAFLAYRTGLHAADTQRDPRNLKPVEKCTK